MKFEQGNWSAVRRGLGLLAVPFVFSGVGCATTPATDDGFNGGGFSGAPASGGAGAPSLVGTGAGTGGSGGQGGSIAVVGGTGGAGGIGNVTVGGSGGSGGAGGAAGAAGMGGMAGGTAGSAPPPAMASCLDGITDFAADGPFTFKMETSGQVKLWVPDVPAGCKVPVIHLANGTGGTCGTYLPIHERFASHGFLATCYEDPNTGSGSQGLMAFETAVMMHPDLADQKFGSTGHSQGGQAAFTVQALAEEKFGPMALYAGLAMEPASGFGTQPSGGTWQTVYAKIKSPMFMFSGTADALVSRAWVSRGFAALADTVEAYHWSATGATHIPVPNAETMEVGVPWFRWKLLGDQAACAAFKALIGADWTSVEEQNAVACM